MNAPLIREGIRLTWITFADPIYDRFQAIFDLAAVVGAVVVGRDPRQVVLQRYREAQK